MLLPVVNLDKAVIGKQVLAFGKSEKSELINIGILLPRREGVKGGTISGRFTPDRERSHVWYIMFKSFSSLKCAVCLWYCAIKF